MDNTATRLSIGNRRLTWQPQSCVMTYTSFNQLIAHDHSIGGVIHINITLFSFRIRELLLPPGLIQVYIESALDHCTEHASRI